MNYARSFMKWISWELPASKHPQPLSLGTWFTLVTFSVFFLGNAMDAYQLFSIPIPWLAALGQGALCCYVLIQRKSFKVPGITPLLILVGWSVGVTVVTSLVREYAAIMPLDSTSSYGVFIALRIATLLSFVATIYVVYFLLEKDCRRHLLTVLTILGVVISVAALYSYIAQVHGLPEIPRNRLATGGGEMGIVSYTYPFHRAVGTFREPGLLAAWLILPLAASVTLRRRLLNGPSVLMGSVLLLTGSMAGILGVGIGAIVAILLVRPRSWISWRRGLDLVIFGAVVIGVFSVVAVPNEGGTTNLLQVVIQRSAPLTSSGLAGSNRGYVYDFFQRHPMPILGYGLGHANLMFSRAAGIAVPVSFLSLYLNIGYSAGIIGLIILCAWVGWPLLRAILARRRHDLSPILFWLFGAYIVWLALSFVTLEELQPPFAVCFAIIVYSLDKERRRDA